MKTAIPLVIRDNHPQVLACGDAVSINENDYRFHSKKQATEICSDIDVLVVAAEVDALNAVAVAVAGAVDLEAPRAATLALSRVFDLVMEMKAHAEGDAGIDNG